MNLDYEEGNENQRCQKYKADSIEEFMEKAKRFGDYNVLVFPYLSSKDSMINVCLNLKSEHAEYDRKIDYRLLKSMKIDLNKVRVLENHLHRITIDIFHDLHENDLFPIVKPIQYRSKDPEEIGDKDIVYLIKLWKIKQGLDDSTRKS